MSEGEPQATHSRPSFLMAATPWAETFSKAVAGIAIALYATGFLTVSIYHSQFGFVGTNPFRPRVLAAGAWFFFFTAIPISIATRFKALPPMKIAKESAALWVGCVVLSMPLSSVLFDVSNPVPSTGSLVWPISFLAVVALTVASDVWKKVPAWLATIASVVATVIYVYHPVTTFFHNSEFELSSLPLWFFGCTIVATVEFKTRTREGLLYDGGWSKPLAVVFVALLLFARNLYPHLRASWGGGTPANITIYFSKDSLLSPNKSVQAQLIEESDEGFYIVGPKESKAIFIPRSAVAMIYFSDKPVDSPMLQNVK